MASLPNYLRTNRTRLALSQEEVAFLLGLHGESKGSTVSREEGTTRVPSLQHALAYEILYGKPVRELFGGMYEEAEREMAERAKTLSFRTSADDSPKRQEALARLTSRLTA